jgi:stage III sporulation protein AB
MKILGMVLILVSCSGLGLIYSTRLKRRVDDFITYKKALILLKSEINYSVTPLPEAFENVGKKIDGYIGEYFTVISKELKNKITGDINKVFKEHALKILQDTCLNKSDIENIVSFSSNLGILDKESQINNIKLQIEVVNEEIENARVDEGKNGKLFKVLGVLGGIFVIVIFI